MIVAGQIIQTNKIDTITILLLGDKTIELHNVAYIPKCNSNLISFNQLRKSEILFYNNLIILQ